MAISIIAHSATRLSRYAPPDRMNSQVGTIYYVAPEVLFADYTDKADIWSIGVVAYVLVSILQFRTPFCFLLFRFIVPIICRSLSFCSFSCADFLPSTLVPRV